jgi:hypothetical protein
VTPEDSLFNYDNVLSNCGVDARSGAERKLNALRDTTKEVKGVNLKLLRQVREPQCAFTTYQKDKILATYSSLTLNSQFGPCAQIELARGGGAVEGTQSTRFPNIEPT